MSEMHGDEGYGALARRLMQDGEAFAKARVALYRELALYRAAQLRAPLALFVIALSLIIAAILAVIIGLVIALSPVLGGIFAGLAVAAGALALAAVLAVIAKQSMPDFRDDPLEVEQHLEDGAG